MPYDFVVVLENWVLDVYNVVTLEVRFFFLRGLLFYFVFVLIIECCSNLFVLRLFQTFCKDCSLLCMLTEVSVLLSLFSANVLTEISLNTRN